MTRALNLFVVGFLNFIGNQLAHAQGAAVIYPMSEAINKVDEAITFYIHNRLGETLNLRFIPVCDVDGVEYNGEKCNAFFQISFDDELKKDLITIPVQERLRGQVRLINKNVSYGLFKPIFDPVLKLERPKSGVQFTFNYQPGYLFISKSVQEKLSLPKFWVEKTKKIKIAKFDFDISQLKTPQVISVSAKYSDKQSGQVIRFLRLANEKIIDPQRKVFKLESEYSKSEKDTPICYELFIQTKWKESEMYTLKGCEE